jgi:hypothetical protein
MKKTFLITLLGATSVMFGQVVPNGPWQTVNTPVTTTGEVITGNSAATNTAYWNNGSTDDGFVGNPGNTGAPGGEGNTACYNIGCYMTSSGAWNLGTYPTGVPAPNGNVPGPGLSSPVFLGANGTGAAINDFSFTGQGAAPNTPMLAEVAGNNDRAWMGWYNTDVINTAADFLTHTRGVDWDIIFTGDQNPTVNNTSTFTPTANFGLLLRRP